MKKIDELKNAIYTRREMIKVEAIVFAIEKRPQLLRHVQHLETAFETTCLAEATHQTTLEQYLL
ncbi:hypothetical protein T03_7684 [Trichinella britovi]|uniref:Uncharacterized protein n=1 Tax=Trichinella britovi TaxID=45882 RepID=A0A0V1CEG7_TRIBR|nr:hypothetical protein T03_7684 [Trichinella britovi]